MKKFIFALLFLPLVALANPAEFEAGKAYQIIDASAPKANTPVDVVEFFSYGCHYCYQLEPTLEEWVSKKGKSINFNRVAVIFNRGWNYYAKAYYTAKLLGINDKMTPALFKAIQEDKKKLQSNQSMEQFFIQHGVDEAMVKSAFEASPTIDGLMQQGMQLMQKYKITAVPTIVVAKRYKTDLVMAGGDPKKMMEIIDFLIAKSKN